MNELEKKIKERKKKLRSKGKDPPDFELVTKTRRPRSRRRAGASKPIEQQAHMKKLEKAAIKLPSLTPSTEQLLQELQTLNLQEATKLHEHLKHFIRSQSLTQAVKVKDNNTVVRGQKVRIVSGNARYMGKTGVVDQVGKIRCFVNVQGAKGRIYLMITDVEPVK